jgi:hypothetical protein
MLNTAGSLYGGKKVGNLWVKSLLPPFKAFFHIKKPGEENRPLQTP